MKQGDSERFGNVCRLRDRAAALAKFEAWDRDHSISLEPAEAISAVSSLYRMLPEEARRREDDPRFIGVRWMLDALGMLGRSYLDPRVHELSVLLERPELEDEYRKRFNAEET